MTDRNEIVAIELGGRPYAKESAALAKIVRNVGTFFVGKETVVRKTLCGALAGGHVLFEDFPGLGKTLLVKAFARSIGADFKRVQFTPDILPSDIIGVRIYDQELRSFRLQKGPVFTNMLLADEINRAPPRTQSALLEAMEERQVTIDGETFRLGPPFFVLATQNPIEQEGTYPLPEAQMDRFMMRLSTGYPSDLDAEEEILARRVGWQKDDPTASVQPAVTQSEFAYLMQVAETKIHTQREVLRYIARVVRAVREDARVYAGPSPRGGLALLKISRAHALMSGRDFVVPDDVKYFAKDALGHRVILKPESQVEGASGTAVVEDALSTVAPPIIGRG
ncbi:MAG: MoxR family ATPase [Euryarchaeota archaeon]|nr:MoxR family ATPase [Euryarchaeota archaeon]